MRLETEERVTSSELHYDGESRRLRRSLVAALPLALIGTWPASAASNPTPGTSPEVEPGAGTPVATPAGTRPETEPDPAVSLPSPGEQRFLVYYGDMSRDVRVGEITYRFDHEDGSYRIGTRAKAIGMLAMFYSGVLIQSSAGRVGGQGLLPERYSERRGDRPQRTISFDHSRQRMLSLAQPPEVFMPPGTQDRLSVFYQLGLMARSRPALFRAGNDFTVPLASLKRIDTPTFSVVGVGSLKTGRGPIPSLHLKVRNEADAKDPIIDVWLASTLGMLPARIRVEEPDGKVIDQVLASAD